MTGLRAGRPSVRSVYAGPGDSPVFVSVPASSARSGTTLASGWSLIRSVDILVFLPSGRGTGPGRVLAWVSLPGPGLYSVGWPLDSASTAWRTLRSVVRVI